MVTINSRTGEVVVAASANEVRSWLNTLNFSWRSKAPSIAEDIYLDYCILTPSGDYAAYLRNLESFKKIILGPLGWTVETLITDSGKEIGLRVPELEEDELSGERESILLDRFWQFYPDAADGLLLQLFSFYAWKLRGHPASHRTHWKSLNDYDWKRIFECTQEAYV